MKYEVRPTKAARADLKSIYRYILKNDGLRQAEAFVRKIEKVTAGLKEMPERGAVPIELVAAGNRAYREVFFKSYRIIYRVQKSTVYIYVIADGRRDMRALLAKRLLWH